MRNSYIFYKEKLEGTYLETFDKIELYCTTTTMDRDTQEELLMELIDVFVTAQKQGKSIDRIVGSDVERFCKNFCSGIGFKYQLKGFADSLKRISWLILIICILDLCALSEETSFMEIKSDVMPILGGFLFGSVLSLFLAAVFRTVMFRSKKINMRLYNITLLLGVVVCCGSSIVVASELYINIYIWVLFLVSAIYLIIYYVMKKLFFSELQKPQKIRFTDKIIEEMPEAWYKRMDKKNKRRINKGKEPMSALEFTYLLQKEHRFDKGIKIGSWGILVALYVGFGIAVGIESEPVDTLIFLIILAIIFIPTGFWFRGINHLTMWQKNTLDYCVQQEIDVFSYFDQQRLDAKAEDIPQESKQETF